MWGFLFYTVKLLNIEFMKNLLRSIAVTGMMFLLSCTLNVSYAGPPPVCDSSPKTELKCVYSDVTIASAIVTATAKETVKAIQVDNSFIASWYSTKVLRLQEKNIGNLNKGYGGSPDKYGERIRSYNLNKIKLSTGKLIRSDHRQYRLRC